MSDTYIAEAIDLLNTAESTLTAEHAVIGFDGFVDQIIRVVGSKTADATTFIPTIDALATRIANAAGKSTAFELDVQQEKLGGNGPIMANAMARLGSQVSYVGAIAQGDGVHPVFAPMAEICDLYPICQVACTDALEFDDGKLMFQRMACLQGLDFQTVVDGVGRDRLKSLWENARFVATNHWSSLPHMTEIWRRVQDEICPELSDRERILFVDLADPEKRSADDIRDALETLAKFEPWYETTLGLNEKESEQICDVLGITSNVADAKERALSNATAIRERVGLKNVTIHAVAFAAASNREGSVVVDGPYEPKPLISTGAGDHFNSGYCTGLLAGGNLKQALQVGVATSGYYVRTAVSPSIPQLKSFLAELASA